jgi:hypothetical protein
MKKIIIVIALLLSYIVTISQVINDHITKSNYLLYNNDTKEIVSADTNIVINNPQGYIVCSHLNYYTLYQTTTKENLILKAKELNLEATLVKEYEYLIK